MPTVVLALDCLKVAVQGMQTLVSSDDGAKRTGLEDRKAV
jgi:hypothetical protein